MSTAPTPGSSLPTSSFMLDTQGVITCLLPSHGYEEPTWCEHIEKLIKDGDDSTLISPGLTVRVPIFPSQGVWVEVEIGDGEPFKDMAASMRMHYTPDIGRPYQIDLGLWNKGEGRWSMRQVILDRLMAKLAPDEKFDSSPIITRCPSSMHGFKQQLSLKNPPSVNWKWACLWYIAMEKACLPCVELSSDPDDNNTGLGDLGGNQPPWRS